jgi:hypothetical protein
VRDVDWRGAVGDLEFMANTGAIAMIAQALSHRRDTACDRLRFIARSFRR